jgi:hypothetical protein
LRRELTLAHCAALDEGRRAKVFQATACTLQRLAASFGARASMLENNKNNLINLHPTSLFGRFLYVFSALLFLRIKKY